MKKSRRTYNGVHLNKKSNTQDVVEQSLTLNLIVALQNSDICCSAIPFTYNIILIQKYLWESLDTVTIFLMFCG